MMTKQGMDPSQVYGNSAIGASPAITYKQKSNLATASGAMGQGASRTIAIQWTFGADALPDVNNPMSVIHAWLRFADSGEVSKAAPTKAWRACYADIQLAVKQDPDHVWEGVTSAMSAKILHLLQLHIKPVGPSFWLRGDTDNIDDTPVKMANPVDRVLHLQWIKDRLSQKVWEHVAPHQANGGLWGGEPADFQRGTKLFTTACWPNERLRKPMPCGPSSHTICGTPPELPKTRICGPASDAEGRTRHCSIGYGRALTTGSAPIPQWSAHRTSSMKQSTVAPPGSILARWRSHRQSATSSTAQGTSSTLQPKDRWQFREDPEGHG